MKYKLITAKNFNVIDIPVVIRSLLAPKFNMPKANFESFFIMTGLPLTVALPDVIDGANSPSSASFTMSEGLETDLTLSQSLESEKLKITVTYSGFGLENMVGKADLIVTVRLWDGLKQSFKDYPIPIVIEEGIPPKFSAPLEDLFVTPGTAVEYQYPEVV